MAQFNLGGCYVVGEGVERDKAEAVKWFRKAAKQGYAEAQFSLGVLYYIGAGVQPDMSLCLPRQSSQARIFGQSKST